MIIRYVGWYSNRSRGERKKLCLLRPGDESEEITDKELTVLDVCDFSPPRVPSKTRWQLIRRVWEVEALTCPK